MRNGDPFPRDGLSWSSLQMARGLLFSNQSRRTGGTLRKFSSNLRHSANTLFSCSSSPRRIGSFIFGSHMGIARWSENCWSSRIFETFQKIKLVRYICLSLPYHIQPDSPGGLVAITRCDPRSSQFEESRRGRRFDFSLRAWRFFFITQVDLNHQYDEPFSFIIMSLVHMQC